MKKTIEIGNTAFGINWVKVDSAIAQGCDFPVVVNNGSFHDSCHLFFLKKRASRKGKVKNIRRWIKKAFDRAVIADCVAFKASKYADGI
jgi:hypothetical protein